MRREGLQSRERQGKGGWAGAATRALRVLPGWAGGQAGGRTTRGADTDQDGLRQIRASPCPARMGTSARKRVVWKHPSPVSPSSCPMGAPALCAQPSGPHLGTRRSECLLSKFPPAQMFCPAATSLGTLQPAARSREGRAFLGCSLLACARCTSPCLPPEVRRGQVEKTLNPAPAFMPGPRPPGAREMDRACPHPFTVTEV